MRLVHVALLLSAAFISIIQAVAAADEQSTKKSLVIEEPPDVLIAVFASKRQYFLSYLLGALERFEYPKERLALWLHEEILVPKGSKTADEIRTEQANLLSQKWFNHFRDRYHPASVSTTGMDDGGNADTQFVEHQNELHEAALALARDIKASSVLFLEPDCMLFDAGMLRDLQILDGDIVAPLLASYTRYTNYWCAVDDNDGSYQLSDRCEKHRKFEEKGSLDVASVYSCYMIKSEKGLASMTFRLSTLTGLSSHAANASSAASVLGLVAKNQDLRVVVSNQRLYGYVIPPLATIDHSTTSENVQRDWDQLAVLQLFLFSRDHYDMLKTSTALQNVVESRRPQMFPSLTAPGLLYDVEKVFVINLDRRPDRMERMQLSLEALGIRYTRYAAVDGRDMTDKQLDALGITLLPGYKDPHRKRAMTRGEIGCFLSHYNIWKEVAVANKAVLVLEDDIRFVPYFTTKLEMLLNDTRRLQLDWDLIYIGRKRMVNAREPQLKGTIRLAEVDYSYWTLGYLLTPLGAQKLLAARPLEKLLPVDEFLPIMFGRHPEQKWSQFYPVQNLTALSAVPLLVEPLFYTGEAEYVSDTEDSLIVGGAYLNDDGTNIKQMRTPRVSETDASDDDTLLNAAAAATVGSSESSLRDEL